MFLFLESLYLDTPIKRSIKLIRHVYLGIFPQNTFIWNCSFESLDIVHGGRSYMDAFIGAAECLFYDQDAFY